VVVAHGLQVSQCLSETEGDLWSVYTPEGNYSFTVNTERYIGCRLQRSAGNIMWRICLHLHPFGAKCNYVVFTLSLLTDTCLSAPPASARYFLFHCQFLLCSNNALCVIIDEIKILYVPKKHYVLIFWFRIMQI